LRVFGFLGSPMVSAPAPEACPLLACPNTGSHTSGTSGSRLAAVSNHDRSAHKKGRLTAVPVIELLPGENKRDGTVEVGDFNRLLPKFDDPDVRDLVEFLYAAGWRVTSVERMEKTDVDYARETVKLRDAVSKNKESMLLSFKTFPTMRAILLRRKDKLRPECKFIFHREGRQIKDFQAEWTKATTAAKLTGLSVHDLCRSCAVNLSRAGIEETTASKYMNRKTLAIYKQYRIVHTRDTERAGAALERYFAAEKNNEKIIDLSERQPHNSHIDDAEVSTGETGNVRN
jgi:Phage integrase family